MKLQLRVRPKKHTHTFVILYLQRNFNVDSDTQMGRFTQSLSHYMPSMRFMKAYSNLLLIGAKKLPNN